jgi:hypothetical protein
MGHFAVNAEMAIDSLLSLDFWEHFKLLESKLFDLINVFFIPVELMIFFPKLIIELNVRRSVI